MVAHPNEWKTTIKSLLKLVLVIQQSIKKRLMLIMIPLLSILFINLLKTKKNAIVVLSIYVLTPHLLSLKSFIQMMQSISGTYV